MDHISSTPFGRPLSLAMVAARVRVENCPPDTIAEKWKVLDNQREAKEALGVSDRALSVLNALLTFHQDTTLSLNADLIVYPSNRSLLLRANGMAPATLRRNLATPVQAGLVIRRDSPNGKRYARKGDRGSDQYFRNVNILDATAWTMKDSGALRMNAGEVCCGADGMSLGLKKAGFRVGLAIDLWPEALKIYRQNIKSPSLLVRLGRHAVRGDLANLVAVVPEALTKSYDIVVGSPPCQDFSAAGSRIEGSRADVTLAFAIFIAALRPRWILMENVPEARKSSAYQRARKILKQAGYGLTEQIVNASFYGVAQARHRFIVIGRLDEADGFLDSALAAARSDKPTSVRDLLGGDIGMHPGDGKSPPETRVYYMRPFSGQPGVRSIDLPCPTIITTSHKPASSRYIKHAKDLARGQDVPPLSLDELSLIQGFPKTWDWSGLTKKNKAQMIANAVPVKLAEALGRIIKERDRGESIPAIETDFVTWLTKAKKARGQVLRKRETYLSRGRKLLNGRMLADIDLELALLEKSKEFAGLSASVKSDIRLSLRLYAEWRDLPRQQRMRELEKEMADAYENDDPQEERAPLKLRIGSKKAA